MKLKKIDLPSKYEYKEGSNPEYKKYDGWNKISYSSYNSFREDAYRGTFLIEKFLGLKQDSGPFAKFGNACGDYISQDNNEYEHLLSDEDKKILDGIPKPDGAQYEFEIIIDLEPFGLEQTCLQGFSDLQYPAPTEGSNMILNVNDFKTLNMDKKKAYYASKEYQQLNIYGYGLEELGYSIFYTGVIGLGRKGNSLEADAKYPMRLSGEIKEIENPYNRKEAEKAIKNICKECIKISDYFKTYKKLFV